MRLKTTCSALALALTLTLGSACSKGESVPVAAEPKPQNAVNMGICFDAHFTKELRPEIVQQSKDGLADALDAWVNDPDGHPELNIVMRKADSGAMHPDAIIIDETIPAVTPVPKKPSIEDPKFDEKNADWMKANSAHSKAIYSGKSIVSRLGTKLRARATLVESNASNITGCMSALTGDFEGGPDVIVLVTDLHDDGETELYKLDGVNVLVVETCSLADQCKENQQKWAPRLEAAGAKVDVITNPKLLSNKLDEMLKEVK